MTRDIIGSLGGHLLQKGLNLPGAEGAIETYGEYVGMAYRSQKGPDGLATERTATLVGHSKRQHKRYLTAGGCHSLLGGKDGSLGIEGVKNSLYEQAVYALLQKGHHLLGVGIRQLVVGYVTTGGIIDIGRHGGRLVCRSHGSHHKSRLLGVTPCVLVGKGASQPYGGTVNVGHQMLTAIISHGYALRGEGVGCDDVGPCLQVATVDVAYYIGTSKTEQVVVALLQQALGQIEAIATEILLRKAIGLYHGAHSTVKDQYSLSDCLLQSHNL